MRFTINPDHPSLPGHFPGHPLVPGVVLLDRVVAAIEAVHGPIGPVRLPQVKFLQPLLPGEEARIEIELRSSDTPAMSGARVLRQAQDERVSGSAHGEPVEPRQAQVLRQAQDERTGWRFRILRGDTLLASGEIVAGA